MGERNSFQPPASPPQVQRLLGMLVADGLAPDTALLTALMMVHQRKGRSDLALRVFQARLGSIPVCAPIKSGYYRQKIDLALHVFQARRTTFPMT